MRPESIAAAQLPGAKVIDDAELQRMQDYVDRQSDPRVIVSTRDVDSTERIDCVQVHLQHGFDVPITVFSTPPTTPTTASSTATPQRYGTTTPLCPTGTIPRRHVRIEDLVKFPTLAAFHKKTPDGHPDLPEHRTANEPPTWPGPSDWHQYATYRQTVTNIGTEAALSLHNPATRVNDEFSLSQLWDARGAGSDQQTAEAGWQVFALKYGDGAGRLFIFYTPDNYSSGCYNLECTAFVQTSNAYTLGGSFSSYSVTGVSEATVDIRIEMNTSKDWWVAVNGTWIGYWPHSLYDTNGLGDNGAQVTYGGEILNDEYLGFHTSTDMGNGYYATSGYLYAAFQRGMHYFGGTYSSPTFNDVTPDSSIITDASCYDASNAYDSTTGRYMFFGGTGYNDFCQ